MVDISYAITDSGTDIIFDCKAQTSASTLAAQITQFTNIAPDRNNNVVTVAVDKDYLNKKKAELDDLTCFDQLLRAVSVALSANVSNQLKEHKKAINLSLDSYNLGKSLVAGIHS